MKKVLTLISCLVMGLMSWAQMPELTLEQHLEDYDFAVKYIEDNYSGFSFWVNDSTQSDYEATKARLRGEVERSERPGWDAVAAYFGWFNDLHLSLHKKYPDEDGNLTVWNKYHEKSKRRILYWKLMVEYDPKPLACKVTDKTFLIRFPSCGGETDSKWIKNSIKQFKKSHCENLIIDVRGNRGGNDGLFEPYRKLLYDHEALLPKPAYRNTPQNLAYLKKVGWNPIVHKLAANNPDAEFLSLGYDLIRYKRVDNSLHKAAMIIDNSVGSSGESIVLMTRACSYRTTIYGRDNTIGCLDFANVAFVELPNSGISFQMPMSREDGLPETSVDKSGIAPDVRIDLPLPARLTDNIDEWVIWVAEQLEK